MPFFDSNGVRIHYEEHGQGAPVILIHGFGAHARNHWGETGLINFLAQRYHVIAPDCRGHGRSDKPHGGEHYGMKNMCGDVLRLLAHRGIRSRCLSAPRWAAGSHSTSSANIPNIFGPPCCPPSASAAPYLNRVRRSGSRPRCWPTTPRRSRMTCPAVSAAGWSCRQRSESARSLHGGRGCTSRLLAD